MKLSGFRKIELTREHKTLMSSGNLSRRLLIGVDVGGTKTAVLVADRQYNTLGQITQPTALGSAEATLQGIAEAILQALAKTGPDIRDVEAVGVGIPGRVDPSTGVVRQAVNLGWHELPVGSRLAARLGVPCLLENDVRIATLGVQHFLGENAPPNIAYMAIGTGIAAGLILDGRLYRGAHGLAGEIGHMVIVPDGPRCACGARGCLEAIAAGPAIARIGQQAASENPGSLLNDFVPVTAEAVYSAAREGDSAALEVTYRVGSYLALSLQQLIMAYDVDCLYIGGGVSRQGDAFLKPILEALAHLRESSPLQTEMLSEENIHLLPPDYNAGTWGAVMLAERSRI